jgi:hypothetical protein
VSYQKYVQAKAVVPHDSTELTGYSGSGWDGLYIGVAGDANLTFQNDGTAILFKNMIAGTLYPFGLNLVKSTSTTATDMVVVDSGRNAS